MNHSSLLRLSSTLDEVIEFAFGYFKRFNPDDPYVRTPEGQRLMQGITEKELASKNRERVRSGKQPLAVGRGGANYPKAGEPTGRTRLTEYSHSRPVAGGPLVKGPGVRIKTYDKDWIEARREAFVQAEAKNRIPGIEKLTAKEREPLMQAAREAKVIETTPTMTTEEMTRGDVKKITGLNREQRIKNLRDFAAMKTAQNRRILHGWRKTQGLGVREAYQKFRPEDMPIYGGRLDVAREGSLEASKSLFKRHRADLQARFEKAIGNIHDIAPAADPGTERSVPREALIRGTAEDLMQNLHERHPLAQAKIAEVLKVGEGKGKPPRSPKYWEKQAKDIQKQYHYHEEATKTADLRRGILTNPTAVREKGILATDPGIFSKLETSPIYKPLPKPPPGLKKTKALGAGLGIAAGVAGGAYLIRRGYKKRQEQLAEQKMSDRSGLIMFIKGKKPRNIIKAAIAKTKKEAERFAEEQRKTRAGGGINMPQAGGTPIPGTNELRQGSSTMYKGETTQEAKLRETQHYAGERKKYWEKLHGKVDPVDLQKAKARHLRKLGREGKLRQAAERAAATQYSQRFIGQTPSMVTPPKRVPNAIKEGKRVFVTPSPYAEELLSKKYPMEGVTATDVGQVMGKTRIREILNPGKLKSPQGSPLEPLSVIPAEQIHAGPSFEDILKKARATAAIQQTEQLLNKGRAEGFQHGHGKGFGEGEIKGAIEERRKQEALREPIERAYEERIKSTYQKGRSQLEQSRRSKVKQIGAAIGGGAVAGGATAWALKPGRKRERELSARLREIRFDNGLLYRIEHPDPQGTRIHDIATGALEGGLVGPFTEPIFAKLQGKKAQGIFKGGWKGFGKRGLIGAGLGAVTTGAVGYAVNAIARAKKAREDARANAMSAKLKLIRFAQKFPVTADYQFAPQDRQRGTGSPIRVVRDRYDKEIINRERNRRDANYARTALVGGVLGGQFKNRLKMPIGRAVVGGAAAGFAAQALTRNLITKYQRDPYGERTVTAKRIDLAPWVGGAAASAGVTVGRAWHKYPSFRKIVRKYFAATGKEIRFQDPNYVPSGEKLSEQDRKQLDKWIYGRRRKTYPVAKEWGKYAQRAGGFVTSARESISGEPSLDARGRPKKKEWEKRWVKGALITGGVAAGIGAGAAALNVLRKAPVGSGRWKLARAWGRRDINSMAKRLVPGYAKTKKFFKGVREEIGYKFDPTAEKWAQKVEEVSGHKPGAEVTSEKDLKKLKEREEGKFSSRVKPIQFAETIYDWRTSDPRGNSVRVYKPLHQKRDRADMPTWKKKGTIEAALGASLATIPLAIWGGHRIGGKSGAKKFYQETRKAAKGTGKAAAVPAETDAYILAKHAEREAVQESEFKALKRAMYKRRYGSDPPAGHPEYYSSKLTRVIRFDDPDKLKQTAAITGGGALTGAVVGSQYIGGHVMKPGENITGKRVVRRHYKFWPAYHEGIGIGGGEVGEVQYRRLRPGIGKVGTVPAERFGRGTVRVLDKHRNIPAAQKARSMIGQNYKYNILTNNCSDFTDLCRGKSRVFSRQWQRTGGGAVIGIGGGLAASYAIKKYQESRDRNLSSVARLIQLHAGQRVIPLVRKINPNLMSRNPLAMDRYKAAALKQYMRNPEERQKLRNELYRLIKQNRRVAFAAKDENQVFTKRNVAITGGIAAAGLGASTLKGAIPFMRIAARNWAAGGAKGLQAGENAAGHFVADYLEGARHGLSGIPGTKALFTSAQKNPKGIPARLISNKLVDPDKLGPAFASSHMLKFMKGGREGLNHWDWEVNKLWEHQHKITSARKPKLAARSLKDMQTRQLEHYYGKEKAMGAIGHLMDNAGIDEHQAIRQVATTGMAYTKAGGLAQNDPQVQRFFKNLAKQKADAAAGYAKKGILSPALIAGGGTTAGTAAFVGSNKKESRKRGPSR